MTTFNATQVGLEVWVANTPLVRNTQAGLEVWIGNTPSMRVTQVGIELWESTTTAGRSVVATQVGLEVWIPASSGTVFTPPPFFWFIE